MPDLHIDRLTLTIRGGDAHAARRLAQQVAAALSRIPMPDDAPARVDRVRVTMPAPAGQDLAGQIATGIHGAIARGVPAADGAIRRS